MIKRLLFEQLTGDGIEFIGSNSSFELYKITDRSGFNHFTQRDNGSVADSHGFTQENWNRYCTGDNAQIPYIFTRIDSNECVAIALSTSGTQNFSIDDVDLKIKYGFEFNNSNYSNLRSEDSILPLYLLPNLFVDENNVIGNGCYINSDNSLLGIFSELTESAENITIPDNVTSISFNAICATKLMGLDLDNLTIKIPRNVEIIASDAINTNNLESVHFVTELEEKPEEWNTNVDIEFDYGITDAEREERAQRRAEAQRAAEEQRAREKAEADQRAAQVVIDYINGLGSNETTEVHYNEENDSAIHTALMDYDELTDDQKELVTNYDVLLHLNDLLYADKQRQEDEENARKSEFERQRLQKRQESNIVIIDNFIIAKINGNEASIVGVKRGVVPEGESSYWSSLNIRIPDAIEGKPVTRIEDNAFVNYKCKKNVCIVLNPEVIKYIGSNAFYNSSVDIGMVGYRRDIQTNQVRIGKAALRNEDNISREARLDTIKDLRALVVNHNWAIEWGKE